MILYLKAKTDLPDLSIDYIEVKLKSGKVVSLTWDETEYDNEDSVYEAKYKGVYFDNDYANGKLHELDGMEISHIQLYTEKDGGYFELVRLEFADGEDALVFENIKYREEWGDNDAG